MDLLTLEIKSLFQRLNEDNYLSILEKEVNRVIKKDKALFQRLKRN